MATTSNSYNNTNLHINNYTSIYEDTIHELSYSDRFRYYITVTINNTNKSAKTNYVYMIKINHLDLFKNGKSGYTFNDLRVFDTDNVTELDFHLESTATEFCLIFVKIPVLNAENKIIYLKFGNKFLANNSNINNTFPILNQAKIWLRPNEAIKENFGQFYDAQYSVSPLSFGNLKRPFVHLETTLSVSAPQVFKNHGTVNMPYFNTLSQNSSWHLGDQQYTQNTDEFTLCSLIRINSIAQATSLFRFQYLPNNEYIVFPYYTGSNNTCIISSDGTDTNGVATTITTGANNLITATYKRNTTNGFKTYINNNLDNQRNSINTALPRVDARMLCLQHPTIAPSQFFRGVFFDCFVFDFSLNSSELTQLHTYMNIKYKIYNTTDIPTFSLSSVQNINNNIVSENISTIINYSSSEEFDNINIGKTYNNTLSINNRIYKQLDDCSLNSNYEYATATTDNIFNQKWVTEFNNLSNISSRYTITNIQNGIERINLKYFNLDTVNNNKLLIRNEDDIYFELFYNSFNKVNSSIGFKTSFASGNSFLQIFDNLNLSSNIVNYVTIPISDFFYSSSSFNLENVNTIQLFISSCDKLQIANIKVIKNWLKDNRIDKNKKISIGTEISEDNKTTAYKDNRDLTIVNRYANDREIELQLKDRIEILKNYTLADLPSFGNEKYIMYYNSYDSIIALSNFDYYINIVKYLVYHFFNDDEIVINLDITAYDLSFISYDNIQKNMKYTVYKSHYNVYDTLQDILKGLFAYIYFDTILNKYVIQSCNYNLFSRNDSKMIPKNINKIKNYNIDKDALDNYNYLDVSVYEQFYSYVDIYYKTGENIKLEIGNNRIIIDKDNLTFDAFDFEIVELPFVTSIMTTTDINNITSVERSNINSININYTSDNTVILDINSNNVQFITLLVIRCKVIYWDQNIKQTKIINKNIGNTKKNELTINHRYIMTVDPNNDGNLYSLSVYEDMMTKLNNNLQTITLSTTYNANYNIGDYVSFYDHNKILKFGNIIQKTINVDKTFNEILKILIE